MVDYPTLGLKYTFLQMSVDIVWVEKLELMVLALGNWVLNIQLSSIIGVELGR
jgi:hypothetical protein